MEKFQTLWPYTAIAAMQLGEALEFVREDGVYFLIARVDGGYIAAGSGGKASIHANARELRIAIVGRELADALAF